MKEPLDILIRNALVYDGGGGGPFKASVGIRDARIVYIGNDKIDSSGIIDSDGLALCPGFIDTHSHSEFSILAAPQCESKIMQGVTTEINGNCGLS
ncbi:MAG TPA: D-aminoacylase, partial [Nitrospirae bacterium]|nr:D-aminoacylase [Nitrospirota bacterium]